MTIPDETITLQRACASWHRIEVYTVPQYEEVYIQSETDAAEEENKGTNADSRWCFLIHSACEEIARKGMKEAFIRTTLQIKSCDSNNETHTRDYVITSLTYAAQATPTVIKLDCKKHLSQACFHLSSANRNNPSWSTLTCPQEAAANSKDRNNPSLKPKATSTWYNDHAPDWREPANAAASALRTAMDPKNTNGRWDADEWPPAYFLGANNAALLKGGIDETGQRVRFIPNWEIKVLETCGQGFASS